MRYDYVKAILLMFVLTVGTYFHPNTAAAASAAEIENNGRRALALLYAKSESARVMGEQAKGVLVFTGIVKGGFIVGGHYGEGVLFKNGKNSGYYDTLQMSYGLQAGLQKYGYALFFMSDSALKWLDRSNGWEVGVGPTIVVVDVGASGAATTTTLQADVYAFFFQQTGLMAGIGIQGTKISKIYK